MQEWINQTLESGTFGMAVLLAAFGLGVGEDGIDGIDGALIAGQIGVE